MKKSFGMNLLVAGCILAIAAACQPRNPKAPASTMSAQESIPREEIQEEDVDLHVYGTNDTSTSVDTEVRIEPESVVADIQEILESTVPAVQKPDEVVVLETAPVVEVEIQNKQD